MHPTQSPQATKPPALEAARAQLAGFLATPLISAPERAWHPSQLTEHQQSQRADFESAMHADGLRALPSCFGELS